MMNKRFYIFGCERSGTNLIRYIMGSHPKCYTGKTDKEHDEGSNRFKYNVFDIKYINDKDGLIDLLKEDNNYIIYIIRNPLAICSSRCYKMYCNESIEEDQRMISIIRMKNMFNNTYRLYNEIKKEYPERIIKITYEDLVTDPAKTIKVICNHFNIDYHEDMINTCNRHSFSIRNVVGFTNSSYKKKFNGIYTSSIDEWKNRLTDDEIDYIKSNFVKTGDYD